MRITFAVDDNTFSADLDAPTSLAIRQTFHAQPNAFGLSDATESPVHAPGFSGDINQGASCNCRRLEMIPHANGTHTESIAHLIDAPVAPADCVPDGFTPTVVVAADLVRLEETDDTYAGHSEPSDRVISRQSLRAAAAPWLEFASSSRTSPALVIHTPGLDVDRTTHRWSGTNPPYFTREAIHWLRDHGFGHLLCDLPSIDRESDGGSLPNHRAWWDLSDSPSDDADLPDAPRHHTITEMIHVPDALQDGRYLLDLQVPALQTDAVPARPVLFPVESNRG